MTTGSHPHPQQQPGDELFTQHVQPDRPAPTLERECLKVPQIVQYKGPRWIEYEKGGEAKKTKKQIFAAQGGTGPWFSVWGSMNLDSQLRQLRPGTLLRLTYLGQEEIDQDNKPHMWEVTATTATASAVAELRSRTPWPERERALLLDIERAQQEALARRDAARAVGEEPPPPDDEPPF